MFRSEYADVTAVELPIHEAVLGHAVRFGDTPALIDGTDGTTLTYEQLDRFHRRIAAALAETGVRKGDVLALHSPNTVSFPVVFYAATRALARHYLTGERFDAAEAVRTGLVTAAGDDVDAVLEPVLDGLRRSCPQALAETKRLLTARVLEAFDRDAAGLTALSARLFSSAQAHEGMTAFLERRDPEWLV